MINNVTLIGRLTKEIDLRYTQNGKAVATFTLAVNRKFKDADGNRAADFISCVLWGKPAEIMSNYTNKGSQVAVTGAIQTRNYENKEGQRVFVTEVNCDNFQLLDSKGGQQEQQSNFNVPPKQEPFNSSNSNAFDIGDDDLPF